MVHTSVGVSGTRMGHEASLCTHVGVSGEAPRTIGVLARIATEALSNAEGIFREENKIGEVVGVRPLLVPPLTPTSTEGHALLTIVCPAV